MTPEIHASIISKHIFTWVQPALILGASRPLQETDCYKLDPSCDSKLIAAKLMTAWNKRVAQAEAYNARIDRGEIGPGLLTKAGWLVGRGEGKGRQEKERIWREKSGRKHPSLVMACNEIFLRWFWVGGIYKRESFSFLLCL